MRKALLHPAETGLGGDAYLEFKHILALGYQLSEVCAAPVHPKLLRWIARVMVRLVHAALSLGYCVSR